MNLLLKKDGNWDLYDHNGMVHSIAKPKTGAVDHPFGSYKYFVHYVDYYTFTGKNLVNQLTDYGYELYKKYGGKRERTNESK